MKKKNPNLYLGFEYQGHRTKVRIPKVRDTALF